MKLKIFISFLSVFTQKSECICMSPPFICGLLCIFQSIIYIRDYNSRHQEVSAYIDYAYRLTTDDFEAYFSGKKRLLPRKTDLRYLSWLCFHLLAFRWERERFKWFWVRREPVKVFCTGSESVIEKSLKEGSCQICLVQRIKFKKDDTAVACLCIFQYPEEPVNSDVL